MAKIPVYHPPKRNPPAPRRNPPSRSSSSGPSRSSSGGGGSSSGGGSKGGGGGGGGGGGANSLKGMQRKAANRYITQAKGMQGQIRALKRSLGNQGFKKALNQRLDNIKLVVGQQDTVLKQGWASRVEGLEDQNEANETAVGDASYANIANRARERGNAVTEALSQGAGESDVLRSQMMSLRSWDANQGEVNRSYYDSLHSLNSSLNDLNVDTKTARINMQSQANADRDQVYSQYYDQRSETLTQLGNAYGMQSELYGMAVEQNGAGKKLRKGATKGSAAAFLNASKENAKVWKNPGVGKNYLDWQGAEAFESQSEGAKIQTAAEVPVSKKPEGANLRKWTT